MSENIENLEIARDAFCSDELKIEKTTVPGTQKNYVSQSAVALRCRVMPPPCIKNPYLMDDSEVDVDPYGNQRSKCAGTVVNKKLLCLQGSYNIFPFSSFFFEWQSCCTMQVLEICFN